MKRHAHTGTSGLILLSSLAAGLWTVPASAQTPERSVSTDEIIVTAQKRSENIQDVPISVSAFNAETLENRGISSVADLAMQMPGVKFGEFSATGTISVRGVGTTIVSGGGENSVATHIDGMYLSQPAALTMVQDDLGGVEVLRGPQGTLYGRNATAGVINFISAKPTDDFQYGVTLGGGDHQRRYAKGYVSGPLGDAARLRLSLQRDDREGYARNVTTGQSLDDLSGVGGRLSLDVDVSSAWSIEARLFARHDDFAGPVYDGFDPSFAVLPAPLADFAPRRVASSATYDSSKQLVGAVVTNSFDLNFATLKSITGYTNFFYNGKFDGIGSVLAVPLDRGLKSNTFSQEFNLQGNTARLDWLVGLFYMNEQIDNRSLTNFSALFGVPANSYITQDSSRQSVSAFVDGTLKLTERVSAFAGVRALSETLDQNLNNVSTTLGVPTTVCSAAATPQSMDDSAVTGRAGLKVDITDDVMIYGQGSRGYKPGGFSQSNCNNPYEAETVDALELGLRSSWMEGRLTFNGAAFYYDNKNLQLEQATPAGIPVVNAPESHVLGAEAELVWRPTSAWRFNAAVTLLDSQYDTFINGDPLLGVAPGTSLKGIALNNAPSYSATLGAEYVFNLSDAGSLTVRGETYTTDKYNLREFDRPYTLQDGYTQVDAFVFWDSPSERYRIRAFVKNATNEDVLGGVLGFGGAIGSYLAPRTYGLELTLKH